jgi:hypothetical protein
MTRSSQFLHEQNFNLLGFVRIVPKTEMGRTCGTYGGEERCIQGFSGKPEGRRPLGRPRRRWEDNIKMDLPEVGWGA